MSWIRRQIRSSIALETPRHSIDLSARARETMTQVVSLLKRAEANYNSLVLLHRTPANQRISDLPSAPTFGFLVRFPIMYQVQPGQNSLQVMFEEFVTLLSKEVRIATCNDCSKFQQILHQRHPYPSRLPRANPAAVSHQRRPHQS